MQKTYEELVAELREIVRKVEDDSTGLEESIALFRKGEELIRECERLLNDAELKITEIAGENRT
ncbi:exodeoxyribonuclease VII small subunit [Methanofollis fontis]|nr:exodeoxyribonuclease VII small subunit [Methanofollis fontis]